MPFSQLTTISSVLIAFELEQRPPSSFVSGRTLPASEGLRRSIDFALSSLPIDSEEARREFLIAPILREIAERYADQITLFAHRSLSAGSSELAGIPDYMIARRSPRGRSVLEMPIVVMVEAKQDDFNGGWAQCIAEMVAAHRLYPSLRRVFGVVSTGDVWRFGYLESGRVFVEEAQVFTIRPLDVLLGAVDGVVSLAVGEMPASAMAAQV